MDCNEPTRKRPHYHHYSLTFDSNQLAQRLKDVRFLLVAGCWRRAQAQAEYLAERTFNGVELAAQKVELLTEASSRFTLFKVGPVLLSDHGMGAASMSIALHELFCMCGQAKVMDRITLIRFGTCGGIGVAPGTLCITNRTFDALFQEHVELKVCMRLVRRPCLVDQNTAALLEQLARKASSENSERLGQYEIKVGATVATNDFYEEQGRTNGAICDHNHEDKMRFLGRARELGVINMEMESNYLAAMCNKLNVPFGVICVALNNRLLDDSAILSKSQLALFQQRLFALNSEFIKHKMAA